MPDVGAAGHWQVHRVAVHAGPRYLGGGAVGEVGEHHVPPAAGVHPRGEPLATIGQPHLVRAEQARGAGQRGLGIVGGEGGPPLERQPPAPAQCTVASHAPPPVLGDLHPTVIPPGNGRPAGRSRRLGDDHRAAFDEAVLKALQDVVDIV